MNALKTSLDLQPARYAAILAEDIASLSRNLSNRYPDWWQSVLTELRYRLESEFTPFDDCTDEWDSDFCRVCGIDNQATHAPWCEERDGTPVAEADRFRIFALAMTAQLATMRNQVETINRWKIEEVETWTDVLHDRQIQHDKRLKALESKQSRNPA